TGYQLSHTSLGVDLEKLAIGAGIGATRTIGSAAEIPAGARLLREANGSAFVLLRVKPTDPPTTKFHMDPAACRLRFRAALLAARGRRRPPWSPEPRPGRWGRAASSPPPPTCASGSPAGSATGSAGSRS